MSNKTVLALQQRIAKLEAELKESKESNAKAWEEGRNSIFRSDTPNPKNPHTQDFETLYEAVVNVAFKIFPKASHIAHLKKVIVEAEEALQDPDDVFEYADCLIAILGAMAKKGFSFEHIYNVTNIKLGVIKDRTWEILPDGSYQHVDSPSNTDDKRT
jgi:hypothetical protein